MIWVSPIGIFTNRQNVKNIGFKVKKFFLKNLVEWIIIRIFVL